MDILGIDHVVLRVRDLAAATDFYLRVLGCAVERHQDEIGLIQLRAGTSLIDLVAVDGKLGRLGGKAPGLDGRNMDHLCLRIANFDVTEVRAHLIRHGVEPGEIGERFGASGTGISIYLKDIDGNGLELRG
jgi:glyoxylase I family protein